MNCNAGNADFGVRGLLKWSGLRALPYVIFILLILPAAFGQGRLLPPESVHSAALGTNRIVRIYLPPSYEHEPKRRYPVLYLHDGQNVFSSAGTNCCFGWGNWELDKTVDALCREGKMREIIMVAVDCTSDRMKEYSGRFAPNRLKQDDYVPSQFENYATFLADELKPKMDREYRTLADPANTGVMGSSMGGLCSAALVMHRPEVFGLAASLSGAFQVDQTNFLRRALPNASSTNDYKFRIYVDSGVVDFTGGNDNRELSAEVANELRRVRGLVGAKTVEYYLDDAPMTEAQMEKAGLRHDKWREAQTSQHNEFYWCQRAWRPLIFLFPAR